MTTGMKMEKEMEDKILALLKETPGKYVDHAIIACRIAPRGITFYRAMQNLVASGRVEQSIMQGYKARA